MRVVTYNVHKCQGLDRRTEPKRIAQVIAEIDPHIAGLQEVFADQAESIASDLGMELALGDVRDVNGKAYGNAVLSKHPLRALCKFDLTVQGREERGCLRTDVYLPDSHVVHLFNLHLGTSFFERRRQAEKLLAKELIQCGYPRVVIGDFNEWSHGLVSRSLRDEFSSADIRKHLGRQRTYPGVLPVLHLDHIYYDEGLDIERAALHKTRTSLIASDHLPLYADFHLSDKLKSDARSSRHSERL